MPLVGGEIEAVLRSHVVRLRLPAVGHVGAQRVRRGRGQRRRGEGRLRHEGLPRRGDHLPGAASRVGAGSTERFRICRKLKVQE